MECVRCSSPNEPQRRFCGQCGAALVSLCPRCDFSNRVVDRFCGGCGDGLSASAQAADRRAAQSPPPPIPRQPSATPATAHRSPAPAAANPAPAPARNGEQLSKQELSELLKPTAAPPAPALPQKVSQDDLDKLFSKGP